MAASSLPQHIQVILERVARENGFQNPRFEVKVASEQGDNFMGQMRRVTVLEADANSKAALNLIIKSAPQNEKRRELYHTKIFFRKEACMYDKVLPALTRLLQTKGILPESQSAFPGTARVYATHLSDDGSEDTIIMEDMGSHGFVMGDRFLGADVEQCRIVIRQLARLHAASIFLKEENPEEHNRLVDSIPETMCISEFAEIMNSFSGKVRTMISGRFPEGTEGRARYDAFAGNMFQTMQELVQEDKELSVIGHGDVWINNILFQYEEGSTIPADACLVDFQLARYASPVCDLAYFFFSSTTKTLRDNHFKQLLQEYYQFLRTFLESFGYPSDKIVSWDVIQDQCRKYMKFGLGMAITVVPIIMTKKGDVQGVEDDVVEGSSLEDTLSDKSGDNPERDERLADVFQDMVDLGYI